MATELPYTLSTLADRIHTLYQNDDQTPATSDGQYTIYLRLINQAIGDWAETQDVFWNELWKTYTTTAVITANQTAYPLAGTQDLRIPSSLIRVTAPNSSTFNLQVIEPGEVDKYLNNSAHYAYFTGNPGIGYSLNLTWTPTATDSLIGATMQFDGQKTANILANPADTPEMSDPNYIIWSTAATLHLLDGNSNLFSVYSTYRDTALDNMRIRNELKPINSNMRADDPDLILDNDSFGF